MFKRVDKLLFDLGYCSKVGLRNFLHNNELTIVKQQPGSKKVTYEKFTGSKKQLRQVIGTNNLLINGQVVHTSDPLIIAFDKPVGWMSDGLGSLYDYQHFQYHQKLKKGIQLGSETPIEILNEENEVEEEEYEEEEYDSQLEEVSQSYSVLDLLPKEYPLRKPGFDSILPLPDTIGGLTVVTQLYTLVKAFRSVRAPCKRVYRIQTRDKFTGLEDEALLHFRSDIKDSLKRIINPPEFNVVDEKNNIAEITIYDYKPDKIEEMMSSIRHQLVDVKRIGLGGLTLDDLNLEQPIVNEEGQVENKEKTWVKLDNDLLEKLMSSKNEVVGRLRVEKDKAQLRREEELKKYATDSNISSLEFSKQDAEQEEFEKETVITEEILGVDEEYDLPKRKPEKIESKSVNINQLNNLESVDIELDETDLEELQKWGDEEEAAFEAEKRKKETAMSNNNKKGKASKKNNKRRN